MATTDYEKYLEKTGKAPQSINALGGGIPAIASRFVVNKGAGYGNIPALGGAIKDTLAPVAKTGLTAMGSAAGRIGENVNQFMLGTPNNKANQPLSANTKLNNGATVGNQSPNIDFSNPSIDTQVLGSGRNQQQNRPFMGENPIELTQRGYFDRQDKANGGMSGTDQTRYTLNEQGQPIRMDNATGQVGLVPNLITQNVLKPSEAPIRLSAPATGFDQIKAAIDRGDISTDQGLSMYRSLNATPEQRQAMAQQEQMQGLMNTAINPPDDGSFTGLGRAKRAQTGAIAGLNTLGSQIQNQGAQQTAQLRELGGMARWQAEQEQKQEAAKQGQKNADREYGLKQDELTLKQEQANKPQTKYTLDTTTGLPVQTQGPQADALYKASTTQEFVNRFNDPEYKSLVEKAQENGMTQQDADRVWLNAVMKHYGMG